MKLGRSLRKQTKIQRDRKQIKKEIDRIDHKVRKLRAMKKQKNAMHNIMGESENTIIE